MVYDELLQLLGAEKADLNRPAAGPRVVLLAGLQVRFTPTPRSVHSCAARGRAGGLHPHAMLCLCRA